jgi:hypothetical protein
MALNRRFHEMNLTDQNAMHLGATKVDFERLQGSSKDEQRPERRPIKEARQEMREHEKEVGKLEEKPMNWKRIRNGRSTWLLRKDRRESLKT